MKKAKSKKAKDDEENLGYLPQAMETVDGKLARLVVEVVVGIVSFLTLRGSKDAETKRRLWDWLRKSESKNLHFFYKVLRWSNGYEIREVEAYFIAETTMPGKSSFDFYGASQSFNVLAEYLFSKNTAKERMEMTTPVLTRKDQSDGEKMEMTTPVITKKTENHDTWQMSFVMPTKYGANLPLPKDSSVRINEVTGKVVAAVAFSGLVTDEVVKQRELKLRIALENDPQFRVKQGASVEVAQYNLPFTLSFTRRNEIALEVEWKDE